MTDKHFTASMRALSKVRLLAAASIIALAAMLQPAPPAFAKKDKARVGLIMSKLPAQGTDDYKRLRALAGKDAKGQGLDLTKSEMWNVSKERAQQIIEAAKQQGVEVQALDDTWNHALAPMKGEAQMSPEQTRMMSETMQSKAVMGMSMMGLPDARVLEYAFSKDMDRTAAGGEQPVLVIPLDNGKTIEARRTSVTHSEDRYTWHGVVEKTGEPVTLLWWPKGKLSGSVTYQGHVYSVKSMGGDMHGVIEMSPKAMPPEHAPMPPEMMQKMNMRSDMVMKSGDASMARPQSRAEPPSAPPFKPVREDTRHLQDANTLRQALTSKSLGGLKLKKASAYPGAKPANITVLVAYTKAAASHYSDIRTDLIELAIEDANQSFRQSGAGNVTLELVHAYETDYVESGTHFEHVFRFADKGDGYMEEVHALRDQYKADVAVLIVHDTNGCGLAAQVHAPADRAFAVVHHECAQNSYSLAHEIGHLIGARHDLALDDTKDPFPFGHGFVNGKRWRTMMSYMDSCDGCPRLPIWSNPELRVRGVVAGSAKSNNARVIAAEAARVAAFR